MRELDRQVFRARGVEGNDVIHIFEKGIYAG